MLLLYVRDTQFYKQIAIRSVILRLAGDIWIEDNVVNCANCSLYVSITLVEVRPRVAETQGNAQSDLLVIRHVWQFFLLWSVNYRMRAYV